MAAKPKTRRYETRRCFDLACPNCKCADSRSYAWCSKYVFELVCGACGYHHDDEKHGRNLSVGEVVPWQ